MGDTVVEQELIYEKLPGDIAKRHVLLMDPILATGNSAARAIQVRRLKPAAVQLLAAAVQSLSAEIGPCSLPRIACVLCNDLAPNCWCAVTCMCSQLLPVMMLAMNCGGIVSLAVHLTFVVLLFSNPEGNPRICPFSNVLLGHVMSADCWYTQQACTQGLLREWRVCHVLLK